MNKLLNVEPRLEKIVYVYVGEEGQQKSRVDT